MLRALPITVHEALQDSSKKLRRDFQAKDQGGPEKQFFSEVWQMLPGLEVTLPGSTKRLKLFEQTQNGYPSYIPMGDIRLKTTFSDDEYMAMKKKAELFYRAIGRLFVHCLCRGHPVPEQVLPKLLCNGKSCRRVVQHRCPLQEAHTASSYHPYHPWEFEAILRDCKPTDPDYCSLELGEHLLNMGWNKKTLEERQQSVSPEEFRKDDAEDTYITDKNVWFQSFRDGFSVKSKSLLTLGFLQRKLAH